MIPVYEPLIGDAEERYVLDCVQSGWISSAGSYIGRFEDSFSDYTGTARGVACSSCTTGIHLALVAMGIGPGDEVIIPSFTLIVSASMVIQAGARPVLADVQPDTWCLDPEDVAAKVTSRTKAVMAVHMYGHPCDLPPLLELCRKHGLKLIEDCAQAHGAQVNGTIVGGFGDVGCFSFYGNKIITTGEGGMNVTDDEQLADRMALLRDQAFEPPRFVHRQLGFNYRMTNVQAALGLGQLERIDEILDKKRSVAQSYTRLLEGVPGLQLPYEAPWAKNVYWMYGVLLGDGFPPRDQVMSMLRERGVDTRAFFYPMHRQPVFQTGADPRWPDVSGSYPVSHMLGERGLYLPSGLTLTDAQIQEVVEKLLACRL